MLLWRYPRRARVTPAAARRGGELSAQALAQPGNARLADEVDTVFRGEALRGRLLNAYGWWKISQITYIISLVSFALGGLMLIASAVFGLAPGRRHGPAFEAAPPVVSGRPVPLIPVSRAVGP